MRSHASIKDIENEVTKLPFSQKLELLENIVLQLKREKSPESGHTMNWSNLYGLGKGLWREDAQALVNRLREERKF